jgi:antitoxin ParD1/3/4
MATSYTLGAHFEEFIKSLIESGRYSTASEVMRDGLRLMEEREQLRAAKMDALRKAIQIGLDSRPAEDFDIDDIKQRGRQRLAAKAHAK